MAALSRTLLHQRPEFRHSEDRCAPWASLFCRAASALVTHITPAAGKLSDRNAST